MTEDVTVTRLLIKPALLAGFLLASTPLAVLAQGYIDVEAERRAAAGEEDRPADVQAVSSEQTFSGIRPYSGSTIVAQPPLESVRQPEAGTDQGSLILRIQRLEADVRRLNGLLEEATQALKQLESQSLKRYVEIDRRLSVGAPESDNDTALSGSVDVTDAQPSGAPGMRPW